MSDEVQKLRPARYIQSDGIIRSYVFREAEGRQILQVTLVVYWNIYIFLNLHIAHYYRIVVSMFFVTNSQLDVLISISF